MDFKLEDWMALRDMTQTRGWCVMSAYLLKSNNNAEKLVFGNADPEKQLLLHQGIGALNVIKEVVEFVTSADAQIAKLEAEASQIDASEANLMKSFDL